MKLQIQNPKRHRSTKSQAPAFKRNALCRMRCWELGYWGFSGVWCLVLGVSSFAATPQQTEFFEKQVRPVLANTCYKCHGADKQKGGLRLDSREALLKG